MDIGDMRLKVALTIAPLAIAGTASAQTIEFWMNTTGSAVTDKPTSITINPGGQDIDLTTYYRAEGISADLLVVQPMFGYSVTDTTGPSATPIENKITLRGTLPQAFTGYNGFAILASDAGGAAADSGNRPYGFQAPNLSFAGLPKDQDVKMFDIRLHANLDPFETRNIVIWRWPVVGDTNWRSVATDATATNYIPAATYTLEVNAVPEPATMAMLAIGAGGLLIRRRRKQA